MWDYSKFKPGDRVTFNDDDGSKKATVIDHRNPNPEPRSSFNSFYNWENQEGKYVALLFDAQEYKNCVHHPYYVVSTIQLQYLIKETSSINNTKLHTQICPVCGATGEALIFKFYCSNNTCKNYHISKG